MNEKLPDRRNNSMLFLAMYVLIMTIFSVVVTTYDTNLVQQTAASAASEYRRVTFNECEAQRAALLLSSSTWDERARSGKRLATYYRSIHAPVPADLWQSLSDESTASRDNDNRAAKALICKP